MENLRQNRLYKTMQSTSRLLDRYYLDAAIGLIPGGIGDILMSVFTAGHLYLSAFCLRSLPLTLAILNNSLRDVFLGMIPFYVGNIIDIFHRSNKLNMQLIDGFIADDPVVMQHVQRKALQSAIACVVLLAAIIAMLALLTWIVMKFGTLIFS